MEMSIDESLEWLMSRKEHYEMDDDCQEIAQALVVATDTMRKYQKIEQIANDKNINGDLLRMSEIRWVLENGNDD